MLIKQIGNLVIIKFHSNIKFFLPPDDFLHLESKYPVVEIEYTGSDFSALSLYL